MKQLGNKLIIFLLFPILFSCSNNFLLSIKKQNKVVTEVYTFYTNDSAKIRFQFFGDYESLNPNDTSFKNHLGVLSGILNSKPKRITKNILVSLKTNVEPWFQTALVVSDKKFLTSKNWKIINSAGHDSRETNFKFKNYDVRVIDLHYEINKKPLLWITWLDEKENLLNNLSEETDTILRRIKLGESYSNFIPANPFTIANDAFIVDLEQGGNYLSPLEILKKNQNNYDTIGINNFYAQALNTYQSFVGIENKNIFPSSEKTVAALKSISFLKNKNAKDSLIKRISENQVVMFNEAHVFPRQRYLVSSLLDTLYKLNFRVLALEAFEKESHTNKNFPNLQNGFYVREPQMANLIRNAQSLGFRIVSYEDTLENSKGREVMQAENLFNSTLKKNPDEKIIVLAGVQHIEENMPPNKKRWMASYFKEISGIDPLTINQTALDNLSFSNDELIFFDGKEISKKLGSDFSNDVYLINHIKPQNFKINPAASDCNVKINLTLDSTKRIENQLIVLVYYDSEFSEQYKLPVYTKLISRNENNLELKLPTEKYYVLVKNSIGQSLFKEKYIISEGCKID